MTTASLHPIIKWAQRKDKIFIEVGLRDIQGESVNLTPTAIAFTGDSAGKKYAFSVELLEEVVPEVHFGWRRPRSGRRTASTWTSCWRRRTRARATGPDSLSNPPSRSTSSATGASGSTRMNSRRRAARASTASTLRPWTVPTFLCRLQRLGLRWREAQAGRFGDQGVDRGRQVARCIDLMYVCYVPAH